MPNEEALKNIGIDSKIVVDGFKWTNQLIFDCCVYLYNTRKEDDKSSFDMIEDFKQSKMKKEEPIPIKVMGLLDGINTMNPPYGKYYTLITDKPIPEEKYEPIKKAIESVLRGNEDMGNIETFNRGYSMGRYDASKYDQKQHSSEELLQARKEARKEGNDALKEILGWINAAISCRKVFPDEIDFDFTLKTLKEQTQDYINSLNK